MAWSDHCASAPPSMAPQRAPRSLRELPSRGSSRSWEARLRAPLADHTHHSHHSQNTSRRPGPPGPGQGRGSRRSPRPPRPGAAWHRSEFVKDFLPLSPRLFLWKAVRGARQRKPPSSSRTPVRRTLRPGPHGPHGPLGCSGCAQLQLLRQAPARGWPGHEGASKGRKYPPFC